MASRAAELRTRDRAERERSGRDRADVEPLERQKDEHRDRLGVVDRRRLRARRERRQVAVLVLASALSIAGALAVVAGGRALVASEQVRSDSLQGAISSALGTEQNLRLEMATLEAPARILHIATTELRMVTPTSVVYLRPVNPGETVAEASRAAAGAGPAHRSTSVTGRKKRGGSSPGRTGTRHPRTTKS